MSLAYRWYEYFVKARYINIYTFTFFFLNDLSQLSEETIPNRAIQPTSYTSVQSQGVSNKAKPINGTNSYNSLPKPHSVLNIDYNADLQSNLLDNK